MLAVRTVNSYIGQETDLVILITGRTSGLGVAGEFILDPRLATVALSRAKHGLFIIGNIDYLTGQQAQVMKGFIDESLKEAPALNGKKYMKYLQNKRMDDQSAYGGNADILLDPADEKLGFIADLDCNKAYGWFEDSIDRKEPIERVYP